jgi:ABC-type phosphate transport system substrate-binding protein
MKKMFIVALVISGALAACGGKKKPATTGPGSDMKGSGDMKGSDAPAGSGSDTPAPAGSGG